MKFYNPITPYLAAIVFIILAIGVGGLYYLQDKVEDVKALKQASQDSTKLQFDAISQGTRLLGQPIEITNIKTFEAYNFNPTKGPAKIEYSMSKAGYVQILIVDRADSTVTIRELIAWDWRDIGNHIEQWDGKDKNNTFVNPKSCRILISAREPQSYSK
jgi:hypothetical protein